MEGKVEQRIKNEFWIFGANKVEIEMRDSEVFDSMLRITFPCGKSDSSIYLSYKNDEDKYAMIDKILMELSKHQRKH